MPYQYPDNIPPQIANKSAEKQKKFVEAFNAALGRGRTEEEAWVAALAAMNSSQVTKKAAILQPKKLPSHVPTIDAYNALRQEQQEEVKKSLSLPAFLSKHSLPSGVSRNVVAMNFDKKGKLVVVFDTGETITTDAVAINEIIEQHIGVSVGQQSASAVGVLEIVAGDNITVDSTDPQRPVVSASGGGGTPIAGDNPVFIQDTQPIYNGKYLWVQTNIDNNPDSFTFWFEDGV